MPTNPQYQQLLSNILAEKNGKHPGTGASSSSLAQGAPPIAPSFNRGYSSSGDIYSGNTSSNGAASGQSSAASNGGIVPFSADATAPPPGSASSGYWGNENGSSYGSYGSGGYYNSGYTGSSRLRRMLTGALVGATAGGLVGSMLHPRYYGYGYGYGRSSYMMSGALWGGMAGLIFGGL
jgi:hypothetical protein